MLLSNLLGKKSNKLSYRPNSFIQLLIIEIIVAKIMSVLVLILSNFFQSISITKDTIDNYTRHCVQIQFCKIPEERAQQEGIRIA